MNEGGDRRISRVYRARGGERGITMLEVLVASTLGLVVLGVAIQTATSNQRLYQSEVVRTRLNQNLRSALDILGINTRQAGENLPSNFPAFEVLSGGSGADQLILRRNLQDAVLNICQALTAGTSVLNVYFAVAGATSSACIYAGQTAAYKAWRSYRTSNGNVVDAYLYNSSAKVGEFVRYSNEVSTGSDYYLVVQPRTWANSYPVGASAAYILEEWKFFLQDGYLKMTQNSSTTTNNIMYGINDMQIRVLKQDGTWATSFTPTDPWSQVAGIEITLSGSDTYRGQTISRSLSARFFPRNVLSL